MDAAIHRSASRCRKTIDFSGSVLVVTSGKPGARSKRIRRPNGAAVGAVVLAEALAQDALQEVVILAHGRALAGFARLTQAIESHCPKAIAAWLAAASHERDER